MTEEKTKFILIGGLISGLTAVLPVIAFINCFCCIGIISGGYISVWLHNKSGYPTLGLADGALMGLLAGIFAALFSTSFELLMIQIFGTSPNTAIMLNYFNQVAEKMNDPELNAQIQDLENMQMNNETTLFSIVSNVIFSAMIYGFFSLLGGMIRTAQDQNKKNNQNNSMGTIE